MALIADLGGDDNLAVTTLELTHLDLTVDFADDSRITRVACFEELSDTRQTARDITSTSLNTRNLNQHITSLDFLTVFNNNMTTNGEVVGAKKFTRRKIVFGLNFYVLFFRIAENMADRHFRSISGLRDDEFAQTCSIIRLDTIGDTFDDILELNPTCGLCDDDSIERIPLCDDIALLDLLAILLVERRTVRNVLREQDNARIDVYEADFGQTTDNHLGRLTCLIEEVDSAELFELKLGIIFGLDHCIGSSVLGHTTSVEGTEGKLSTRLTDGLGCDDADGLTLLHHTRRSEVATIALHADAMLRLTSEHAANLDALDRAGLNLCCNGLGDFLASSDDELVVRRIDDIMDADTTEDTIVERADDLVTILKGGADKTTKGAAVLLGDDDVVRDIHQTTCQVTCVGRLQSGIGKTLTGTVR